MRKCSKCGNEMIDGYMEESGFAYYCSEPCLHLVYTPEEYMQQYEKGNVFWTDWYDEVSADHCATCDEPLGAMCAVVGEWDENYCDQHCVLEAYTTEEVADMASKRIYKYKVSKLQLNRMKRYRALQGFLELYSRRDGWLSLQPTAENLENVLDLLVSWEMHREEIGIKCEPMTDYAAELLEVME